MTETTVFRFQVQGDNGPLHIAVDPFRIERLLARSLGGEPLRDVLTQARAPQQTLAFPAVEKLLKATCDAFALELVKPDGTGHTEEAVFRVLSEYLRWKADVKKNTASPAISSPPTASPPLADPLPPKSCSDCGS